LKNVEQARYLMNLVEESEDLELLSPTDLNIVCFRYAPQGVAESDLNDLNEEILYRIQESGFAVPSGTTLNGRYALRCSVTNHRSRRQDFDQLIKVVKQVGAEVLA
jgi:glutamate/tyrosine decarboxylase-like PLP-dependent enzyme